MHRTRSVDVRDLSRRATQIVRQVRLQRMAVQITDRGKVIAQRIPVRERKTGSKEASVVWTDLDRLAAEIGAHWPAASSAVDAVREGRREL